MESIEIDTLPVHFGEAIPGIDGMVHVARGIERDSNSMVFHVDDVRRKAYVGTGIVLDSDVARVPHLDRIAARGCNAIACYESIGGAGGPCVGMRPDGITRDAADGCASDLEMTNA